MFCRLCLHKSDTDYFASLFAADAELKWQNLIYQHLNLKITSTDAHSKVICVACLKKLQEFHEFYQLVKNRQMLLLEIETNVQTSTKQTTLETTAISAVEKPGSSVEKVSFDERLEPATIKSEILYEDNVNISETEPYGNELPSGSKWNLENVGERLDQHTCVVCKKVLNSNVSLKAHINDVHMHPLVNKSNDSKRKFEAKDERHKRHKPNQTIANSLRDETADRTCILCNKTFMRMSTLLAHMKKFHNDVHPFECGKCGVKFLTHHGLSGHFEISKDCAKANELVEINSNQKELNFAKQLDEANAAYRTCDVCKRLFENWKYLEKHMHTKHDGIKHFLCKSCKQTFLLRLHFHNHLKSTPSCIGTTKAQLVGL